MNFLENTCEMLNLQKLFGCIWNIVCLQATNSMLFVLFAVWLIHNISRKTAAHIGRDLDSSSLFAGPSLMCVKGAGGGEAVSWHVTEGRRGERSKAKLGTTRRESGRDYHLALTVLICMWYGSQLKCPSSGARRFATPTPLPSEGPNQPKFVFAWR